MVSIVRTLSKVLLKLAADLALGPTSTCARRATRPRQHAVHDEHLVSDRAVDEDGVMRGDAGDPEACRQLVADAVRKLDSEFGRL